MARQEGRGEVWRQVGLNKLHRQEAESGMRWLLKRWWFWVATLVLMATLSISVVFISASQSVTCRAKFDRIPDSMGEKELRQIASELGELSDFGILDSKCLVLVWADRTGQLLLTYEEDSGKVMGKEFRPRPVWGQVCWMAVRMLNKMGVDFDYR
ncbi:MAG TPA: hypothetical protein VGY66_21480 [Gemmataceae bacterium]|jgi:hypothetical protein|nr:hypothetical protein [Gemmataceae bacterium]